MAQIEIARQAASAEAEIKRIMAAADIEIAQWKARQWAEIERFKVGLKAEKPNGAQRGHEPRVGSWHEACGCSDASQSVCSNNYIWSCHTVGYCNQQRVGRGCSDPPHAIA